MRLFQIWFAWWSTYIETLSPSRNSGIFSKLLGCVFIAMISNGLIHWGIDPDLNRVVKGIIIFLAVVINSNFTFKSNSGGPKED